ncbi:hypothetical protein PR202_ga08945 [Eleusine coracana subsp. coracana]|uniref:Transcription repressor n=1 Tax=Eleusine coracana subsp. coracana TaxID=191504 RepID=A0AAV5C4J7_ELECO|nr:hypothetical protein QOZ80_1AG0040890 [Eleusine coracana subsp. coracana]GJM92469.1 hypothetical protein PR202_ga08945 [Eleusine coracana subsp. coracana]
MAPAWPWPSSKNPRTTTQSSRSGSAAPPGTKTIASIFHDSLESSFTTSSAPPDCSDTISTISEPSATCGDPADDAIVRGLLSDRLLFDPPGASATSSILEEKASPGASAEKEAFVGGEAVAFESANPYADFRASMVEMVAAHGVCGDWGWMEEMLAWYLRANDPDTHCAIVAAFIDVVIAIADPAGEARSSPSGRSSSARMFPEAEFEVAEKSKAGLLIA